MHGDFRPQLSTGRLHGSRKAGGRGLISVEQTIVEETHNINEYFRAKSNRDNFLNALRVASAESSTEGVDQQKWKDKKLHGMFHRQIQDIADMGKIYQWLGKRGLNSGTEALIAAAQEQALNTRYIEAHIYKKHTHDNRCRLCKIAPETIVHIINRCKILSGKSYMERHNQVAAIVYRDIYDTLGLKTQQSKWVIPRNVIENARAKVLWDFLMQTDGEVIANQPDIIVMDETKRTIQRIDITIPNQAKRT